MRINTNITCLCQDQNLVKLDSLKFHNGRGLYRCKSCGLHQLYPYSVENNQDASIYTKTDYMSKIQDAEYRGYFMVLFKTAISHWVNKNSAILDFGAGQCYYHKFLDEMGYENVHSVEINPNLVEAAKQKLKLNNVSTDVTKLPANHFDIVISNMVFEHLYDPVSLVNTELHRILKDDGRLVFTIPNFASLNRLLLGRSWIGYSPEEHIWFFSPSSIRHIFGKSDLFSIETINIKAAINTRYDAFRPSSLIKRAYYNTFMRLFEFIGRGDQVVVVLKKNAKNSLQESVR